MKRTYAEKYLEGFLINNLPPIDIRQTHIIISSDFIISTLIESIGVIKIISFPQKTFYQSRYGH